MPYVYVITTREHTADTPINGWPVSSRHAVATLDAARRMVEDASLRDGLATVDGFTRIREEGGEVGPLSNVGMIRVERVELSERARHALSLACDTRGVTTHGNVAKALERRGLVEVAEAAYGKPYIEPTALGREVNDAYKL